MLSQDLPGVFVGALEHVLGTGSLPDIILIAIDDLGGPLRSAEVVHRVIVGQEASSRFGARDRIQGKSLFAYRKPFH